jgi:hypothetical protein
VGNNDEGIALLHKKNHWEKCITMGYGCVLQAKIEELRTRRSQLERNFNLLTSEAPGDDGTKHHVPNLLICAIPSMVRTAKEKFPYPKREWV